MPFAGIEQPETIVLNETYRLRKYDGSYEQALAGYQDPVVYQNSEGIFDPARMPDLGYVRGMFRYLDSAGELYFIEALENGEYVAVGDVTAKPENPPIAIWYPRHRGKGLGFLAMQAVIERLRATGCRRIMGSTVYTWNAASLALHKKLGFSVVAQTENEYILEKEL